MIGLGWLQTVNQKWYEGLYRPLRHINRRWYQRKFDSSRAINMMAADWDTLVLLDGCRIDTYYSVVGEDLGPMDTVISPASESWGFMQETYVGRSFADSVYVTANPHTHKLPEDTFHAIVDAKETHWDDESETVRPADLTMVALDAHQRYPDKRIIVHYMQPHYPFLGPSGSFDRSSIDGDSNGFHPWQEQSWGNPIGRERLMEAYRENLELTIPHVQRLLEDIEGRVVISSDHANLLGDLALPFPLRVWGHPENFPHPTLLEVPWIIARRTPRRDITEGGLNVERPDYDNGDEIREHLEALGYY